MRSARNPLTLRRTFVLLVLFVLALGTFGGYWWWKRQLPGLVVSPLLGAIQLPPGFKIEMYASGVPNARSLALGARGTVFVGSRRAGTVYAVVDGDHDNRADRVIPIATGLNQPNGVAFRDGALYVAEVSRILRFDDIESRLDSPPAPVVVNDSLPRDQLHGWKFIRFGPDGSSLEMYAHGIRNTVGFDWHPGTRELWLTDNGRDWMGDDLPPDELNHAPQPGMNFGFPYCHGKDNPDPEFGQKHACSEFTPPAIELGPHVAALGMRFYVGPMFPPEYRHQIFIAEHGSWNRRTPIGYRLTLVRLEGNRAVKYETFAEGWLSGRWPWGRPVDVEVMPDGALLVSDDLARAIYRISYRQSTERGGRHFSWSSMGCAGSQRGWRRWPGERGKFDCATWSTKPRRCPGRDSSAR